MKKNDIVVLTTAFKQKDSYTDDYFASLNNQTCKSFDVLIVNDGIDFQQVKKRYPYLNIIEFSGVGNIAKNRELLINSSIDLGYSKAIFADFDDYFSQDRIAVVSQLLDNYDLVVNELAIVSEDVVVKESYFENEFKEGQEVRIDAVLESNFFGMSNTGIRTSRLQKVSFEKGITAVDWFFFSTLLLEGKKAVYTGRCKTYYRQHGANISNIGRVTVEQLISEIRVKKHHYSLLAPRHHQYESLLSAVIDFCSCAEDDSFVKDYHKLVSKDKHSPFWWSIFNENEYWTIKDEINKKG